MFEEPPLRVGLPVVYFDDDKQPHAAIIARLLTEEQTDYGRPRVMLTWLGYDGRWFPGRFVEPAHHDGEQWVLLNKWAFEGEVE